jgi:nucleotide-binding universal stress UspA family protein
MYRSILVSLDGSRFAEAALPWALALGRSGSADLHLASVHEPIPSFSYDEWESAAWDWSEEYLARVRERLTPQCPGTVDAWVGSGRVVDCLLKRAADVSADLVVMATHGRGAFTRAWLGSVTDGLLRHTTLPVLVVRPGDEPAEVGAELPKIDSIVVPLDGSDLAESELAEARVLAKEFGAAVHLVRVVAYPAEIASPYLPHTVQMNQRLVEEAREIAETYVQERADRLKQEGIAVESHVLVDAQAGHAIAQVVDEVGADLVIMATHGRGGLQRALLGSTTDKVIRAVDVPVLVRRPTPND